jgi:hypothetical protein
MKVKTLKVVKTTPHATGRNNKQGANYRLQMKQNNGLTNIKKVSCCNKHLEIKIQFKASGQRPLSGEKEFYKIKEILIDFIILYGLQRMILAHITAV